MRSERYIMHADMDAFFAAIEQRDNPAIAGKPVIIGADPKGGHGRGVVSTCSYQARKFGVHSAMPISRAYRLCPQGIYIKPDGNKYGAVSRQVYEIFSRFTPDIEPLSVDEAFLDITGSWKLFGAKPADACLRLKALVRKETGLTVSVGLAPNKLAAKIASDLHKPDGFVQVTAKGLLDFLFPLAIGRIPGLGPHACALLNAAGIKTIGELALRTPEELNRLLGSASGEYFWRLANGLDQRPVAPSREAKSLSAETTFDSDTGRQSEIETALLGLAEKVARHLRREKLKARQTSIKIRLEGFATFTRTAPPHEPTQLADGIYNTALALLRAFNREGKLVRLVGIRAGALLQEENDLRLFRPQGEKQSLALAKTLDSIREKYGYGAIMRARLK